MKIICMLSRKDMHLKLSSKDRRKDFFFYICALCSQSLRWKHDEDVSSSYGMATTKSKLSFEGWRNGSSVFFQCFQISERELLCLKVTRPRSFLLFIRLLFRRNMHKEDLWNYTEGRSCSKRQPPSRPVPLYPPVTWHELVRARTRITVVKEAGE